MNNLNSLLLDRWYGNPGATWEAIRREEDELGVAFPEEYASLLLWSNGGEGEFGDNYLRLWAVQKLSEQNRAKKLDIHLPGFVGIGSDGGDVCLVLDYRTSANTPSLAAVPLDDLDVRSVTLCGANFREGIENIVYGRILL